MSIIINNAHLYKTAVNPSGFPTDGLPEFAFVGRSNVGKSTLINKMAGRKALARTSGAPGKTRGINFFIIENKLYFVDLPGYGYAKVSKSEKEKWGVMIESYLKGREQLKIVILLVDIRRDPSEDDKMMYDWFKFYEQKIIVVATKSDKIKRSQFNKHTSAIRKGLGLAEDEKVILFSKESPGDRETLWAEIDVI